MYTAFRHFCRDVSCPQTRLTKLPVRKRNTNLSMYLSLYVYVSICICKCKCKCVKEPPPGIYHLSDDGFDPQLGLYKIFF